MESNETKIKRVLKTAGVFNWARQNFQRFDDTLRQVWNIAEDPPRISLGPINKICTKLANREITFEDAMKQCEGYKGHLRMAADEILPVFYNYLIENQIDTVSGFAEERYPYPFGRDEGGKVRTIPVQPTFIALQGERAIPTFVLGWTKPDFSYHQIRLISTIIADAVLTQQDFIGSDAMIITLPRSKWGKHREIRRWMVSSYANMSREELQTQFDRYNRAVRQVVEELKGRE